MALTRNTYQRNSTWNAPYTFSGKEKDAETGYGYFGARYYDSGLSIWLSVDPMSDKYPSMSPYNYCANNPVMLVDPDGRAVVDIDGGDDPMGRGNGPAPNQTNKPAPLKFHYSNYLRPQQGTGSTSANTPNNKNVNPKKRSPLFKFNFNINLDGGGGVHFYNKSDRERSGPTRKTDKDVNMVDITNFPTGTGSSTATTIPEFFGNMVGLMGRGMTLAEVSLEYQQKVQDQKKQEEVDAYKNQTIYFEIYIDINGTASTVGTSCPRKDSLDEVNKVRKAHGIK